MFWRACTENSSPRTTWMRTREYTSPSMTALTITRAHTARFSRSHLGVSVRPCLPRISPHFIRSRA